MWLAYAGPVPYEFEPIGFVRSPFTERRAAPRQPAMAAGVAGRIELAAGRGFEDAVLGIEAWGRAWVIFVFHKNVEQARGWKPKIQPPRSDRKHGVFATRSPHRPNPIGLSAVAIDRVEGRVVHVRGLDLLDGTPVLDLKPYVAYTDAHPDSRAGWLAPGDPLPSWSVTFTDVAQAQIDWLRVRGVDLRRPVEEVLSLGPQPHAYRRIRARAGGFTLAVKEWRVDFVLEGRRIAVVSLRSGYSPGDLVVRPGLGLHTSFRAAFG
jgi:tRNA-Thr(GGU) m(6)t(6)A37 methyltransferase TsaA